MLWLIENVDQIAFTELSGFVPKLSPGRRARVLSTSHEPAKVRSVLAELLLRHALREEYGLNELPAIETGEKGKPFFPERRDIHFNLSHCKPAVACVLADTPVGVDVQEYRTFYRDKHCLSAPPIYRILSEPERAWVEAGESQADQNRRFTAVWTCKEAWGKALGAGFLYDLRSTCFIPDKESWRQYGKSFLHQSHEAYELTLCSESSLPIQNLSTSEFLNKRVQSFI